jgi:hypothetical protein
VEVTVEDRAPMVRCYECGSSQVSGLCHHCWRPGCAKHILPSPRWTEKLFGREGGGPGLQKISARHCGDCTHVRAGTAGTTRRLLALCVAGIGLAAIGLISVWLSSIAGLIFLVTGGISATWACLVVRRSSVRARVGMPVPLHPKFADVQVIEKLAGEITLASHDGDYRTVLEPVEGKISMSLTFGRPDRDRVWRRRKRLQAQDAEVPYCAGRLVLRGQFGIRAGDQLAGSVLALGGDASDYPVFRVEDPPSSSLRNLAWRYELRTEPEISSGPVWITPSIVPESERHALELDIQWIEFGPDEDKPLSLDMIEMLRLEVPVSWGEIHSWSIPQNISAQQPAVRGLMPDGRQWLELKGLRPAKREREDQDRRTTRLTLSMRFEGQINPEDEISGRLEATMQGTLSGITGIWLFNSLGARRTHTGEAVVKTRLGVNFRLSLASIRYQAVRVVPDRAAEDSDRDSYADEFAVVPGDETVIALTNAMSEEGYYVKHIIENPPRSGRRADLVQRYWDIGGRLYAGVYPIDFHIILTGEEVHGGGIRPQGGTTKVRIVVKGAFTDDEMDTRIDGEWKRLRELTLETLGRRDSAAGEPR